MKGKVVASPSSGCGGSCESVLPIVVRAPKCSNYAIINLLFGLYMFV
jgi:hypothetical protein